MTDSRNRMKVHSKNQIRDLNGKKRRIFLSDEPHNARECRRDHILRGGGVEGGMMKRCPVESTLASYPVFSRLRRQKTDSSQEIKRIGL